MKLIDKFITLHSYSLSLFDCLLGLDDVSLHSVDFKSLSATVECSSFGKMGYDENVCERAEHFKSFGWLETIITNQRWRFLSFSI